MHEEQELENNPKDPQQEKSNGDVQQEPKRPSEGPSFVKIFFQRLGRLRRLRLATKVVGTMAIIVASVAMVMVSQATEKLAHSLEASYASKGEAIALSLAAATEQSSGNSSTVIQGSIDSNKIIEGVQYIFVKDGMGQISVHTFSPSFPEWLKKSNPISLMEVAGWKNQRTKTNRVSYQLGERQLRALDVAAPVGGGALGSVHVGMDAALIDSKVADLQQKMFVYGGVVALIGIFVALLMLVLTVIRPIRQLTMVTTEIVHSGDLTQPIKIKAHDEIGDLANSFRSMVEKLRTIPVNLLESTKRLNNSVNALSMATKGQSSDINAQAVALQEAQTTVQEIKQTSVVAAQKAESVLGVIERADAVSRSGEQAIEESLTAMNDIRAQVNEIAEQINGLRQRTRQIGLITETVKDLADQSNMLALNAAIEAVRSGEHGKGFAVVAREIRTLADKSIQATNRVRDVLNDIGLATETAVQITEVGSKNMESGLTQVRTTGTKLRELSSIVADNVSAVRQIAAAVNQQNAGITQIVDAVGSLNSQMDKTVERLDITNDSVDSLREVTAIVSDMVSSFRV